MNMKIILPLLLIIYSSFALSHEIKLVRSRGVFKETIVLEFKENKFIINTNSNFLSKGKK